MKFINGITSYLETYYEVVSYLTLTEKEGTEYNARTEYGTGGMYDLARELTDEFEKLHENRSWDGEFFDEIEEFLDDKIKLQ